MSAVPETLLVAVASQPLAVVVPPEPWWQSSFFVGLIGALAGAVSSLLAQHRALTHERHLQRRALDHERKLQLEFAHSLLLHALSRRASAIKQAGFALRNIPHNAAEVIRPLVAFESDSSRYDDALARLEDARLGAQVREWLAESSSVVLLAEDAIRIRLAALRESTVSTPLTEDIGRLAVMLESSVETVDKLSAWLQESLQAMRRRYGDS